MRCAERNILADAEVAIDHAHSCEYHSPLTDYNGERRLGSQAPRNRAVLNRGTSSLARLSAAKPAVYSEEAGQSVQSSLSDAPNGKSSRLLTAVLTVESQPALAEVVVPSVR